MSEDVFVVMMPAALRDRFRWWLDNVGYKLTPGPTATTVQFVVVPIAGQPLHDPHGERYAGPSWDD